MRYNQGAPAPDDQMLWGLHVYRSGATVILGNVEAFASEDAFARFEVEAIELLTPALGELAAMLITEMLIASASQCANQDALGALGSPEEVGT